MVVLENVDKIIDSNNNELTIADAVGSAGLVNNGVMTGVDTVVTTAGNTINMNYLSFAVSASGGAESQYTDEFGINWKVHQFTSSGSFTVTEHGNIQFLCVGGGGGGGWNWGGGGGAGAFKTGEQFFNKGTYTITIGAGGSQSTMGSNTLIKSGTIELVKALGGGRGGGNAGSVGSGASGGGGLNGSNNSGGIGLDGNNGGDAHFNYYFAGGGGGAGTAGSNAQATGTVSGYGGDGGAGLPSDILGAIYYWCGGGGGYSQEYAGDGGRGGGGPGGTFGGTYADGTNSTFWGALGPDGLNPATRGAHWEYGSHAGINTGSGGGGGYHKGGAGGSGFVAIRYQVFS